MRYILIYGVLILLACSQTCMYYLNIQEKKLSESQYNLCQVQMANLTLDNQILQKKCAKSQDEYLKIDRQYTTLKNKSSVLSQYILKLFDDKFFENYESIANRDINVMSDESIEKLYYDYKPLLDTLPSPNIKEKVRYLIGYAKYTKKTNDKARNTTPAPDNQ